MRSLSRFQKMELKCSSGKTIRKLNWCRSVLDVIHCSDRRMVNWKNILFSLASVMSYKASMGGAEIWDHHVERNINKKWILKTTVHFLDLAVVHFWILYKRDDKANMLLRKQRLCLIEFILSLSKNFYDVLLSKKKISWVISVRTMRKRYAESCGYKFYNSCIKILSESNKIKCNLPMVCLDDLKITRRFCFQNCSSRTRVGCEKCEVCLSLPPNNNYFKYFQSLWSGFS